MADFPPFPLRSHGAVHPWHDVNPDGGGLPARFTAIIEIPLGGSSKYELDKQTGLLKLDRVLYSAVYYPANYGFIPQTFADSRRHPLSGSRLARHRAGTQALPGVGFRREDQRLTTTRRAWQGKLGVRGLEFEVPRHRVTECNWFAEHAANTERDPQTRYLTPTPRTYDAAPNSELPGSRT
jgi:hypothetical protein